MEDLTKQQLILLALLVSFVTSIATGIMTVSLMQQAPVQATQTINQIVERTVEKVVPAPASQQATVIKETIVVSIEDQAVKAVEKTTPSLVRIKNLETKEIVAIGTVVSKDGLIVTDRVSVKPAGQYAATLSDGSEVSLQAVPKDNLYGSLWRANIADKPKKVSIVPALLGSSDSLKLGQSVIALYGRDSLKVSLGIVQGLDSDLATSTGVTATTTADQKGGPTRIATNVPATVSGSPLLNLSGEVVGIKIGEIGGGFVPINAFKDLLK